MQTQPPTRDMEARLARVAARQHGVVARRQLLGLGFGPGAIKHRAALGRVHAVHRGVYAVGHKALSDQGRWMAAVLACGTGAVLSHTSAAALWGIRQGRRLEVVTRSRCRRPGIRVHQIDLPSDELALENRIPTTTATRTLFDLASLLSPPALQRAMREADFLRLESPISLRALLERYPGHRGNGTLRAVLGAPSDGTSASDLEDLFIAFLEEYDLPMPRINQRIEGFKVDFHWPEARLIVETDGRQSHRTAHAFEHDRERDRILSAADWRIVRITWRQLHEDRAAVAADLRRLLEAPRGR